MSINDEIELVKSAMGGDTRAFELIVNAYKEKVIHICFSYCNNWQDAEDIAQDIFVEVYKSLRKFNEKSSFSTWLYRIASNKAIDYLRAQKRLKRGSGLLSRIAEDNYLAMNASTGTYASDEIIQEQRKEFLYAGLAKLADRQRKAFVLTQIEGLSQKEVAEVMETTVKSVEVLVVRARKKLKVLLAKQIKNYL